MSSLVAWWLGFWSLTIMAWSESLVWKCSHKLQWRREKKKKVWFYLFWKNSGHITTNKRLWYIDYFWKQRHLGKQQEKTFSDLSWLSTDRSCKMNSSIIDVLLGNFINYRRLTLITEEETGSLLHTQTTLSQTIILPICSSKGPFIFPKNHSFYPYIPGGSDGKASAYNTGDLGSTPGLGRPPGERNGNPLQYSCLENPMDGGAW